MNDLREIWPRWAQSLHRDPRRPWLHVAVRPIFAGSGSVSSSSQSAWRCNRRRRILQDEISDDVVTLQSGGRDRQRTMNCIRLNAVDMSTAPGAINRWKRSACQDEPMLICCLLTMTDSFYSCYSKGSGVCAWIRRLADDRRRDRSSIPIAPAD